MKQKLKFSLSNIIFIPITYVLFHLFFKYFKFNNETAAAINEIPLSYGNEFIEFMELLKMPDIYLTAISYLTLCIFVLLLTIIFSQYKNKFIVSSLLLFTLSTGSFLTYKTYQAEKYIDNSIPVISKILENEVIYKGNKFERAFFYNTKYYIKEYNKNPTAENKLKYSVSLFFIPNNLKLIKTINDINVEKYTEVMKLNIKTQLNYNYFAISSIIYLFLISLFNIFILYRNRKQ